ncbi:hypothetical protein [Streptomyces sp. NPDC006307]|uniref:hypothetical protein n=1 Tax=Streptomyces sp. NPDC006307 TaxID=3156748 RepID=UPI0033AE5F09
MADDRVKGFHASLHLNMGKAHQDLHHPDQARAHYERAAAHLDDLPPGPYADAIRFAVADGLRTTGTPAEGPLTDLISRWCARGDLRALALVLPPYLGDLGTDEDRTRLTTALHMVHAGRRLPRDEQQNLGRALASLVR